MKPIWALPARALARAVREGTLRAGEVAEAFLARVRAVDPRVKAFLHLDEDVVRRGAERIEAKRARGEPLGPLAGVPVAVKDNIAVRGEPLTCASRILAGYTAPYDAHAVERLRAADALLFGRTNLDEFAMGSTTETSAFFPTRNPWALDRVPGGSSGGSAAAVAARLAPLALGSDTGGSVRQPAALCGIYGLKPTYGRVSRYGLVAYGSSLDQIGPLAWDAADLELLFRVIAGPDSRDATSLPAGEPLPPPEAANLRVGVPAEFLAAAQPPVREAVRRAEEVFRAAGAEVRSLSLPHTAAAISAYYLIAPAEAASNLARYDGVRYGARAEAPSLAALFAQTRGRGFGHEVKKRIVLGTFALSRGYHEAYYRKACQVRTLVARDFARAFGEVDLLLAPTSPILACPLGTIQADPLALYRMDVLTVPASLAGVPALNVPLGFADGLPVGVQLMAPPLGEERLFAAARLLGEAATGEEVPPL